MEVTCDNAMNMIVSGAGLEEVNGLYVEEGTYNDRPRYQLYDEDGATDVFLAYNAMSGDGWAISYWGQTPFYESYDNVPTPDLCVTWIVLAGTLPLPTVTKESEPPSPGTLSDLTVSANITISGNVLHVTLDNAVLNATIDVTAAAFSGITLENLTSSSAIAVKAQASLSRGLDNVSAMAFGEVYTGINSPYQDIVSWVGHPLSGSTVKVRLGNLRGIFGENGEFGIYAGAGWNAQSGLPPDVNSQYIRLGNYTNEFHNVPVKLYDSGSVTMQLEPTSPSFAMGDPLPSGFGVGIGLWQGKDTDGTYKWRVGNPSGANLSWNGVSLLLQNASLDVSGSNVHIALGNPPPTSKTSGTGIWMDNSGIYGLHNNVKQVYIDTTTGIFYSGAGTVRVDEAGANIVIGTHDENNRLTGIELNSTGLFGKVADDVRFALANTGVPFLKLGIGEKDVDLTGIQIDSNEMAGQENGIDQAVFSSDGKILAGRGDIVLDGEGIAIKSLRKAISFYEDNDEIGVLGIASMNEIGGNNEIALYLSNKRKNANLVLNGSFSSGSDNWTFGTQTYLDDSDAYSPPYSVILFYLGQTFPQGQSITSDNFSIIPDKTYTASFMTKIVPHGTYHTAISVWIEFYNEQNNYISNISLVVGSPYNIWQQINTTFTTPATAATARIYASMTANQQDMEYVLFDDFTITEGVGQSIELYDDKIYLRGQAEFNETPILPATPPTSGNHAAIKSYVDTKVSKTGNENIEGVKFFASIPYLPEWDPVEPRQAARKAYVDSLIPTGVLSTPVPTASAGAFTAVSSYCRSYSFGKLHQFSGFLYINTVGSASGTIRVPIPAAILEELAGGHWAGAATTSAGIACSCRLLPTNNYLEILKYDGTSVIANGLGISFSIFYEVE